MFAGLAPSLWMSAAYQVAYILGGVALIIFARPLARFTQREKKRSRVENRARVLAALRGQRRVKGSS